MNKFAKKIMNAHTLVGYQDDSIVSKEIIKQEHGTVSFFAFDAGQGLSEHTVAYDALILVIDGEAEIRINDELFIVTQGNMLLMPADQPHRVIAKSRLKMMLALVKP